jgi:hypothetical protein
LAMARETGRCTSVPTSSLRVNSLGASIPGLVEMVAVTQVLCHTGVAQ